VRSRSNLLVLLGVAFFVVGGVIVYFLTSDDDDGGSGDGGRVTAVVGTEDISPGALASDLVEAGKLQTQEFAANALPPGAVSTLNQLEGATFVQGYAAGQPITSLGLQLEARTFDVPEGFDAVAVQIDFVAGGAGYVNIGDRINLYVAINSALTDQTVPRAELLLTNVEVLDVNLTIPPRRGASIDPADANVPRATGENVTYLLALRAADIEKVVWATEFESLYASLTANDAPPAGPTPGRDPETILQEEPNVAFDG
jgi:pilus assembly protein CpaB